MLENIEFPTYNEAEEYCRENNLSYDVIEYAGDYATINVNLNKQTDKQTRSYIVYYINSVDKTAYTVVNAAIDTAQAVEKARKTLRGEIRKVILVLPV